VIKAGRHVVWVDYEDSRRTLDGRLALLGVTKEDIARYLHYCHPEEPWDAGALSRVLLNLDGFDVSVVVVDSLGEGLSIEERSEDNDNEVAPILHLWRQFAGITGAALVIIDHQTKAASQPLHPSGTKRKKAAVDGAMYRVDVSRAFSKEQAGYAAIRCTKDRHGNYRLEQTVAVFSVDPESETPFQLRKPKHENVKVDGDEGPSWTEERHIIVVRRAVEVIKRQGQPVSKREAKALIREGGTFQASNDAIVAALDSGARLGCLDPGKGLRNADTFSFVRDVTQEDADRLAGRFAGGLG
jgi:hypothetical protein